MPLRRLTYLGRADWPGLKSWLSGRKNPDQAVEAKVREILADVRERGDLAVAEYTRRFDCPDFAPDRLRVPAEAIRSARDQVPAGDLAIFAEAIANVRDFHERQKEQSFLTTRADGAILGQLVRPVRRVGLYVPGGRGGETPLLSSLIMNAVPAQVAGVESLAVCTPPRKDGSVSPSILAVADLLGLDEILLMGSAWAIAALAYGTQRIEACDLLAGPGNIFVATAKSLVAGEVGLDMLAGPSEICILADASANPQWLAADMLSQAEHDPLAACLCISPDQGLLDGVAAELSAQLDRLPRGEIARQSLRDWGALVHVPDLAAGLDLVNRAAPEHLELAVADPWPLLGGLRNAGAVFMGHHSPEPVGDYFAGPNHVLPTLGTARFSQALSVQTFCKRSSLIATTPAFLAAHGDKIARMARLEGLEAHARSVESRNPKP